MNEWPIVPISELCEFIVDCLHETPEIVDYKTGYWMVRTSDTGNGYISLESARNVTKEVYLRRIQRGIPQKGDIVISREAPLGEVGRISTDDMICLGQRLIHYKPNVEKVNPRYLVYALLSPSVQAEFHANKGVGSVVDNLRMNVARSLPIPLLPRENQNFIADLLGSLDDKIELNRRMNATLEATTRALFQSWFVDFDPVHAKARGEQPSGMDTATAALFPDHFEDSPLGPIPAGWRVGTLGDEIELAYGKPLKADTRIEGGIPVYGSNGQVGWHNEKLVSGPGIIVGRKGNPGTVVWSQTDFFPIDTTFYVIPKTDLPLNYLFSMLQMQDLPSLSADSAVPGLNRNLAYMNLIFIPPDGLLSIFDELTSSLINQIDCNAKESRTLAETRDALLPKLVSGEVRIEESLYG